jgi:hypothetical protein
VVAALTALVVAPAPSYDPWAWLLWGREVAGLGLSTAEGPAFKPLPVAICALLSVLGGAAPAAWVVVARAGAALAVWLAFRLGRRLAGGSVAAGAAAGAGVALCGGFLAYAAAGAETGWLIALALLGAEAWRGGRHWAALLCGVGCALLRVEAWPFVVALGCVLWRRRPEDRWLLAACAAAVPAMWLVPELIGSGDLLRSGARARVPNPGQPATAAVPALAALREAAALPLWPLWVGAAACLVLPAARAARPLLAAGAGWIALVAVMAQAGFSGEPRYSLPGAAAIAIAGAAGLAALVRVGSERLTNAGREPMRAAGVARSAARRAAVPALACAALVVAAAPTISGIADLRRGQAWQRGLATDLEAVIRAAGGREAVLACGRPYVGPLRGPLLAYELGVEKRTVGFEPRPPGTVFRSKLHAAVATEPPAVPGFSPLARTGRWEVRAAC